MGLPQLAVIPFIPKLMKLVDARVIIGLGIPLFGGSAFFDIHLDSNFAGPQFYVPLIVRAVSQPLIMTPLSAITTVGCVLLASGTVLLFMKKIRLIGPAGGH